MAGTRLTIQTTVVVYMLGLVWVSVYRGFCTSRCKKGNLTKDFPKVSGTDDPYGNIPTDTTTETTSAVQAQWWEDALCHPIGAAADAILDALGSSQSDATTKSTPTSNKISKKTPSDISEEEDDPWSFLELTMTLAVENTTLLPEWIGEMSRSFSEDRDGTDDGSSSVFLDLMSRHKMDLQVLPPLIDGDPAAFWSHYKRNAFGSAVGNQPSHERLVVYLPARLGFPDESTKRIQWRAYNAQPTGDTTSTNTLVLPSFSSEPTGISSGRLKPLLEDWMARSIAAQDQRRAKQQQRDRETSDAFTHHEPRPRLTREFPIEHFLAILMPLLFPLLLPFLVSWVKEYKRYKKLVAAKREPSKETTAAKLKAE